MDKQALEATISSLEDWGRSLDHWVLICAASTAIFLAAGIVFGIFHWLNENRLRPLRAQQAAFFSDELVKLRKSTDEAKERAQNAEERAVKAELALGRVNAPRLLTTAQQLRIANRVRQFSGTPFDCATHPTAEPGGFLEQIASALDAAGWTRTAHEGGNATVGTMHGKPKIGVINTGFVGLGIEIADERSSKWGAAVAMLGAALEAEGITAIRMNTVNDGSANPIAVHIIVGLKP
jgi:hypothetical protein